MESAKARAGSVPRFALKRDEAAEALAISVGTFDNWIKAGRMPKGKKIGGNTLWDSDAVHRAWKAQWEDGDDGDNPFNGVVA